MFFSYWNAQEIHLKYIYSIEESIMELLVLYLVYLLYIKKIHLLLVFYQV